MGTRTIAASFAAVLALPVLACAPAAGPGAPGAPGSDVAPAPVLLESLAPADERWVEETLASLSLRERVGQLVVPWIPGAYASTTDPAFLEIEGWVEDLGIGGVVVSIGLPHAYAAKLNELQERARVPLLVSSDFESGGPGMRLNQGYALPSLLPMGGGTEFPPTMAFGAIGEERFAHALGRVTAEEARAVGVHLLLAPVLDVNSNPENPVINTRSFGADPELVARLGSAFIAGAEEGGALSTAKHFPGHGDTRTDSHVELPVIAADRARLEAVELVPFRAAVDAGVDAVMTAHVSVPGVLGAEAPPATLSPRLMTGLLREEMGFEGVLFTDALRMAAISGRFGAGEAAVLAIEAGSDVILSPESLEGAIDAVVGAVESGRLAAERIDASVRRLLRLKARAGLHRGRRVSLEAVDEVVGSGAHLALADTAAERSITLPRDRRGMVPLDPARDRRVLAVTYAPSRDLLAGRTFERLLAEGLAAVVRRRVDETTPAAVYDTLAAWAQTADAVVVSVLVPASAGAGRAAVPEPLARFVRDAEAAAPTAVISFGNPYLLTAFPEVGSYLLAWGPRPVSQRAAAGALLGRTAIRGTLPIPLPPHHAPGEGLAREPRPGAAAEVTRRSGEIETWRGDAGLEGAGVGAPPVPPEGAPPREPPLSGVVVRGPAGLDTIPVVHSPMEADPASVGMSEDELLALDSLILRAIADSAAPGVALAVGRRGRIVRLRGYGSLDWADPYRLASPGTVYDLASLTKVVGTTTAVMMLADDGRIDLDAPVVRYLPGWSAGDPRKEAVTVRHLLLHRGGLPAFRRWYAEIQGEAAYRAAVAEEPLEYEPGTRTVYSDIGFITLGWIVEAVSGRPLDAFLEERLFEPLGMVDTGFRPAADLLGRIAPTEVDTIFRHRHVHGEVHDENAFAMGGVAGHAGLFSTAWDLAVFAQMMLDAGAAAPCRPRTAHGFPCPVTRTDSLRLVDPETVHRFVRPWDDASSRALGWDTFAPRSSGGSCLTEAAYGHTGFTGGSIWIDPELDLFVVLLTNRVNPTRENRRHIALRRDVHDAVVGSFHDGVAPVPARCR